MNLLDVLLLVIGGIAGGAVNSIAGGGTFIMYPLLLSMGVAPVSANASCSVGVLPGQVSSAVGYTQYIKKLPKRYYLLLIPFFFGALAGAYLLTHTSNRQFEFVVPWFILFATLLLVFQPQLHKWLYSKQGQALEHKHSIIFVLLISLSVFSLALYGGYFGAGYGIIMLGLLGLSKLTNIHQMNGLKNLGGIVIASVASIYFINKGIVAWSILPGLMIGNALGGWLGATYSTKLPTKIIRTLVICIGIVLSVILFVKAHR